MHAPLICVYACTPQVEKEAAVQVEAERIGKMDRVGRVRNLIAAALNLRCPRCRVPFGGFDGCCALSCSTCPCRFCAWCLHDCGDKDAHPHVRACPYKPEGVDAYFPQPLSKFDEHWRKRRAGIVMGMLRDQCTAEEETLLLKDQLLEDLHAELDAARHAMPRRPE